MRNVRKRASGAMTEGAKEYLAQATAKQADWRGTCRVCGAKLEGTMKELMEHAESHEASRA